VSLQAIQYPQAPSRSLVVTCGRCRELQLMMAVSLARMPRVVTPNFKAKPNAHSKCAQESSLNTYRIEDGYIITNVTIYNIYLLNNALPKTKSNTR
jgi:hypothetical protein